MLNKRVKAWSFIVLLSLLFLGVTAVSAQNGTPILINLDQNQAGELNQAQTSLTYVVGVTQPQLITIQVLGLSTGFVPTFSVFDPAGLSVYNANNQNVSIISTTQAFINPGAYRIVVSSGNGQLGQFVISLQGGGALQPPQAISAGQVINGVVSAEAQLLMYSFSASQSDVLRLTVRSTLPNTSPMVLLQDATTGETLGTANGRLLGAEFRIPASVGLVNYRVQVNYNTNGGGEQSYLLCLESESAAPTCPAGASSVVPQGIPSPTPLPATLVPLPNTGSCVIAPSGNTNVNVRSAPNTTASVLGQLPANTTAPVSGKLPDSSWYQINYNGVQAWVSASVVRLGGQCGAVPVINPNPTAPQPTLAPTSSSPSSPTLPPAPTAVSAQLNFSLPPNFGSNSLTSGFVPDPFTVGITSGGAVDVSYLGAGCTGFASSAPDFSLNYTSGPFPTLRFYFVGSGDTTMIINAPNGSYRCIDDSFGTLNPTLDYETPLSGRYDVWIGSFAQGTNISGTLNITENTANHP